MMYGVFKENSLFSMFSCSEEQSISGIVSSYLLSGHRVLALTDAEVKYGRRLFLRQSDDSLRVAPEKPSDDEFLTFDVNSESWVDGRTQEQKIEAALGRRANLLQSSDWTQLPDVPLATRESWATYRQALRDITSQPGYPTDIIWPNNRKKESKT